MILGGVIYGAPFFLEKISYYFDPTENRNPQNEAKDKAIK